MKIAANDNEPFFTNAYKLMRDTGSLLEQIQEEQERKRQEYIQRQLIDIGRI